MSEPTSPYRPPSDVPFFIGLGLLGGFYVFIVVAMVLADLGYTSAGHVGDALRDPKIRYSIKLSLISCTITTVISLWVAVPLGYVLSRYRFWGRTILDTILDIPIVLPPLVLGLSLLILFQTSGGRWFQDNVFQVTYEIPSVILAQFAVAAAFAVRTMRVTFDQIDTRQEQVALTLGCSRGQAFWRVTFPQAWRGMLTAATLAWARSLGEFGPVLIFSGATPMRTEVLPTSVFLELNVGHLEGAVAISFLMIVIAMIVLVLMRVFGLQASRTL